MRNWQRWTLSIGIALAVGLLQAIEESSTLMEALKHTAHSLLPTLLALKMTLNENEK